MKKFGHLIRAFDALVAFGEAARRLKGGGGSSPPPPETALSQGVPGGGLAGQLEARLTNVVVAALKEAFDRDHARLELERAQLDEARRRAEEAMRLEVRRQAAERELGRLRLLAGTALVGWIVSIVTLAVRAGAASDATRVVLAGGWLLLLGALAAAFVAQGRIGGAISGADAPLDPGPAAPAALWLLVAGLALTAASLLIA